MGFTCTPMSPTLPGFPGKPKTPWKDNKNKCSTREEIFSSFRCSFSQTWNSLWKVSLPGDRFYHDQSQLFPTKTKKELQSLLEESKQWHTEIPACSCKYQKVAPWPDHNLRLFSMTPRDAYSKKHDAHVSIFTEELKGEDKHFTSYPFGPTSPASPGRPSWKDNSRKCKSKIDLVTESEMRTNKYRTEIIPAQLLCRGQWQLEVKVLFLPVFSKHKYIQTNFDDL